jgi:hypothetical protein
MRVRKQREGQTRSLALLIKITMPCHAYSDIHQACTFHPKTAIFSFFSLNILFFSSSSHKPPTLGMSYFDALWTIRRRK